MPSRVQAILTFGAVMRFVQEDQRKAAYAGRVATQPVEARVLQGLHANMNRIYISNGFL